MEIHYSENLRECLQANQYDKIYLTRGLNRSIYVFNEAQWLAVKDEITKNDRLSPLAKEVFDYFVTEPQDMKSKKYAFIYIPKHLEEWSQISKNVVLIHWLNKRIEIWAKEFFPMMEFEGTAKQ